MPSTFRHGADRRAGTEAHERPTGTEQGAADQIRSDESSFYLERDDTEADEQVDANHSNNDGREHELEDRHVSEQHGANLLFKSQHTSLLQQDAKNDSSSEPEYQFPIHSDAPFVR